MVDCRDCKPKNRRTCIGKSHYTYQDIRFCPRQVFYIIENFLALERDNLIIKRYEWLPDPTTFIPDEVIYATKRVSKEAYFCKPMELVAEIQSRLNRCGRRGTLLVASIMGGLALEHLPNEAWLTLLYISGWRRKRISFSQWQYKRERSNGSN